MLLLVGALLSVEMGCFVAVAGQERRVKLWFLLLCASTTALSIGLWIEVNLPNWMFAAARANMTSALMIAAMGLMSARAMCGLKFNFTVAALLILASIADIATVWVTSIYFTGETIQYSWGRYVAGNHLFFVTPLLTAVVALYGLVNLWTNFTQAHPLEKNRTKYLFLANFFLLVAAFDFLPHFGVDLFRGPVSGIAIPLFLATYSYAMLRYRLFEFRSFVGRAAGWFLATVLMIVVYALVVEFGKRLDTPLQQTYIAAAIAGLASWIGVGQRLPDWAQRALSSESDFRDRIQAFGDEIVALGDEGLMREKLKALCINDFGAVTATFVEGVQVPNDKRMHFFNEEILEKEVVRRSGGFWPDALSDADVVLPLVRQDILLGLVSLGTRADGEMYTHGMLAALRHAANIFGVTVANLRSAKELEKRHQLDRYLAPQIVDSILAGHPEIVTTKNRRLITIFFSDIKDFSILADRLDPGTLAVVLNDYLSEMAEIAFSFGGTVDKFIGDSVMVIFGAPLDTDPALQANQCVRMALAMHHRTKALNAEWIEKGLFRSRLISRMGIHTGEATVGSFGSAKRLGYTAIGRSVNLASRLEQHCAPGHVLVSAECWRYLSNAFPGECRGSIQVKGFSEPIEVYQIDLETTGPLLRTEEVRTT